MIKRALAIAFVVFPAWAHDFWIEPSTFRPAAGEAVVLQLRVGEPFRGEPVAIQPARIERFFARSASGEQQIGSSGIVRGSTPNPTVVGYHSRPSGVRLEPQAFESYLREEGLESIIALREQRGDSDKPSREIFSRCAKTVLAGEEDRTLGLRLEIVRGSKDVTVIFEGSPLPNALVMAVRRGEEKRPLSGRTDAHGMVTFPAFERGVWLVKTVHMVPSMTPSDMADWESIWASETFEIP